MEYDVYYDESGDLGWTLNKAYRNGGSSKFFTIAYIIIPTTKNKLITRFLKKFHQERGGKEKEIKGASIRNSRTKSIARKIQALLELNKDIIVGSITVNKNNAPSRLVNTNNDNVLYDYMVKCGICSKISAFTQVNIVPDKRSVPTGSLNSCSDLLKSSLWLELGSEAKISYTPEESQNNTRLMFIDWIANFIWRNYEDKNKDAYQILKPYLKEDVLF